MDRRRRARQRAAAARVRRARRNLARAACDAIVCINMIHIAPWAAAEGLFAARSACCSRGSSTSTARTACTAPHRAEQRGLRRSLRRANPNGACATSGRGALAAARLALAERRHARQQPERRLQVDRQAARARKSLPGTALASKPRNKADVADVPCLLMLVARAGRLRAAAAQPAGHRGEALRARARQSGDLPGARRPRYLARGRDGDAGRQHDGQHLSRAPISAGWSSPGRHQIRGYAGDNGSIDARRGARPDVFHPAVGLAHVTGFAQSFFRPDPRAVRPRGACCAANS